MKQFTRSIISSSKNLLFQKCCTTCIEFECEEKITLFKSPTQRPTKKFFFSASFFKLSAQRCKIQKNKFDHGNFLLPSRTYLAIPYCTIFTFLISHYTM